MAGPRLLVVLLACLPAGLDAQAVPDLARERAAYAEWLAGSALSPFATVALQRIGSGLTLGPEGSDIPLPDLPATRVAEERGGVILFQGSDRRALPRNRPVSVGGYRLLVSGSSGRTLLAVYGSVHGAHPPMFFPPAEGMAFTVPLEPPERSGSFPTLGLDGAETPATEAGFVALVLGGQPVRLRVYRMGAAEDEEAELQIFFRDATNGKATYPAGRFLVLDPAPGRRVRLDFNRARNPFCAYSSVFPCPAPWPGNAIPVEVRAGEQYGAPGTAP